ncbi:I78 family peptidase inhibitor [Pusillimonas sp.]|uniref:I78 family peptidase inhibitor n=1 Tax=Pusillimonas sp. TaxID=3040095 RepID=UPI0037C763E7
MQKLGIVLLAILGGCASATDSQKPQQVGMANPASVYCQQVGGKLTIENTPAGLAGMCELPDGSKIEEWELFKAASQCGADSRQNLVGTLESSLDQSTLPTLSRIINPDSAVTMDYRQERLNVYVDESGKIERVTCG